MKKLLIVMLFFQSILSIKAWSTSFGDFYVFNAKLLDAEEDEAENLSNDFIDRIRKKYEVLKAENSEYRNYIQKRIEALEWLKLDNSLPSLINRLDEIFSGKMRAARPDESTYERSRMIAIWAKHKRLSIEKSSKASEKNELALYYFLEAKAYFHFCGLGKGSFDKFLDLSAGTEDKKTLKYREDAQYILRLIQSSRSFRGDSNREKHEQ